jgi:hypothetical protein
METMPIKETLLAVLNDATAPQDKRRLAADTLAFYNDFDIPSESDKGVVATLREWRAALIWSGTLTLIKNEGRFDVVRTMDLPPAVTS